MIAVATGVVGGFVVGLTSVGSGTIFGLVMLIAFPLTAAKIVGTDIFHAAILLAVAGAGHLVAGHVDLAATGWLLIGSVPGVLIGGRFTVALPDRALRIALAATLTLAGVKLVDPPGADAIVLSGGVVAGYRSRRDGVRWLVDAGASVAARAGRRGLPPAREACGTRSRGARSPSAFQNGTEIGLPAYVSSSATSAPRSRPQSSAASTSRVATPRRR